MDMKTALIGVGTITKDYYLGLSESKFIELVALADIVDNPVGRQYFPDLPFYTSVEKMLEEQEIEYVIISTPPANHYETIKYMLLRGINVIVEKPAVLDIDELRELASIARKSKCVFNTSFHWQNGSEVRLFNRLYDKKKISSIYIHVDDPYSDDGVNINESKIKLEGSFVDSGVNALSLVKMWLPFKEYSIQSSEIVFAQNVHLPIYANVQLLIDGIPVRIEIDWRNQKNQKISYIEYDGRSVTIDHSNQAVIDGDAVYTRDSMIRLSRHYYNYFKYFKGKSNYINSIKIHNVLLGVKKHYD